MALAAPAASAVSTTPAQVRERQVGDLFEYHIEHPVTIRRNQSALVPIVLRPFEGRPVLLYNKAARPQNPLRCVELKNTTGLTLEGGPVTVLESGSYVGEAMLDTTRPGDERLLPYAVELSVRVLDNIDSHEQPVHRVVLKGGVLLLQRLLVRQTTYHIDNKGERDQVLYLDHPRGPEWELLETAAPRETTENHWRFRFDLPAKKATAFVVRQRQVLEQINRLGDLDADGLAWWLEQKHFDARTLAALRGLADLRGRAADEERHIKRLQEERATIHEEQKRLRENLQALGDRSAEKDLRERLVRVLGTQEDRLERIAAEVQAHTEELRRCQERFRAGLDALNYEATL
jgi:hypothetical protein